MWTSPIAKRCRRALEKANDLLRLAVVVRDAYDAITVQDLDGRIIAWNPGAVRMYGWSEAEALVMNVRDRIPEGLRENELAKMHQLSQAEILEPYRTQRITKDGTIVEVWITATALVNEAGKMYAIATTERVTEFEIDRVKMGPTMNRRDDRPGNYAKLRWQAEEILREKGTWSPEKLGTLSPEETRQTLHELCVHQIELEMQNEELRRTQVELDDARARYFDLYDLAPVGYCTISEKGLIQEANLTAATLLGVTRRRAGQAALYPVHPHGRSGHLLPAQQISFLRRARRRCTNCGW